MTIKYLSSSNGRFFADCVMVKWLLVLFICTYSFEIKAQELVRRAIIGACEQSAKRYAPISIGIAKTASQISQMPIGKYREEMALNLKIEVDKVRDKFLQELMNEKDSTPAKTEREQIFNDVWYKTHRATLDQAILFGLTKFDLTEIRSRVELEDDCRKYYLK